MEGTGCGDAPPSRSSLRQWADQTEGSHVLPEPVTPVLSRRQTMILVALLVLSVAATGVVLLGPARGAREDIGHVQTDLDATRGGIRATLQVSRRTLSQLSAQLEVTQTSLEIQQEGLGVARRSQRVAGSTARATESIRRQTAETLATIRQVIAALGPLRELRGDLSTVTEGVQAGVALARSTLDVGRQALRDGKQALDVAITTLETLKRSEQVQRDLLVVGRRTLEQVVQINRKLPTPPVFPAARATSP
jgi:hypothetical protein